MLVFGVLFDFFSPLGSSEEGLAICQELEDSVCFSRGEEFACQSACLLRQSKNKLPLTCYILYCLVVVEKQLLNCTPLSCTIGGSLR